MHLITYQPQLYVYMMTHVPANGSLKLLQMTASVMFMVAVSLYFIRLYTKHGCRSMAPAFIILAYKNNGT